MKEKLMLILFASSVFGAIVIPFADSAIPPTPAWVNIATNDTNSTTNPAWANATKYNDSLWIITDGSILIEVVQYNGTQQ